jgi:hypothetical protein
LRPGKNVGEFFSKETAIKKLKESYNYKFALYISAFLYALKSITKPETFKNEIFY